MTFIELTMAKGKKQKVLIALESICYITKDHFIDEPAVITTNGGTITVLETYDEVCDKIRSAND